MSPLGLLASSLLSMVAKSRGKSLCTPCETLTCDSGVGRLRGLDIRNHGPTFAQACLVNDCPNLISGLPEKSSFSTGTFRSC